MDALGKFRRGRAISGLRELQEALERALKQQQLRSLRELSTLAGIQCLQKRAVQARA